jgi:hypothetical protein
VSPVAIDTEGQRVAVSARSRLSVWLPSDWHVDQEQQLLEFLALGPSDQAYRANVSIHHNSVDGELTLEAVAEATARKQAEILQTFVEYDRRPAELAGWPAMQREYGWVQGGTGLVLYQLEVLALPGATPGLMLEVHATSAAPEYFRYAALLRRIIESIQPDSNP